MLLVASRSSGLPAVAQPMGKSAASVARKREMEDVHQFSRKLAENSKKMNLFQGVHHRSLTVCPWKMMVGRLLSFWEGNSSRPVLNFTWVNSLEEFQGRAICSGKSALNDWSHTLLYVPSGQSCYNHYPLVNDHIAGWNDIPMFQPGSIHRLTQSGAPMIEAVWSV